MGKPGREERVLGLSFITGERNPTFSRLVRAIPAQERERSRGAAAAENSREFHRIAHGYGAEFRFRDRAGIRAEAKDCCILTLQRLRECGAVREVMMQNLFQLGCEMASVLRPIAVTNATAGFANA